MTRASFWLVLALLSATRLQADDAFRVPAGFRFESFADDALAHDVYSLTHDAAGRAVVSGPGYIRRLEDVNSDGRADAAVTLFDGPQTGAQGLCFVGDALYFTGDGGLWKLTGADAEGRYASRPERLFELANGEHGGHQIVQGPDGWLYVVCGNESGVSAAHVRGRHSPITAPQSGAILRCSLDGETVEILADGFRNPYDLAFSGDGRLWTVDSDGERDQFLPWYAPTRVFEVVCGARYGWASGGWAKSWSKPACWFDSASRWAELGRGSPTGAIVYRHAAFPRRYRDGLFTACWTLGRVYFVPLYGEGPPEIFLEALGNEGLAPVDLEVGPDGDLWVAVGGRGTRGGVLRVFYDEPTRDRRELEPRLDNPLLAPHPTSAWSRAPWEARARQLGRERLLEYATSGGPTVARAERLRAIEILTELFGGLSPAAAESLVDDPDPVIAARAVWSLGAGSPEEWKSRLLARATHAASPSVQRAAWEALARVADDGVLDDVDTASWPLRSLDGRGLQAMAAALRRSPLDLAKTAVATHTDDAVESLRAAQVAALLGRSPTIAEALRHCRAAFAAANPFAESASRRLEAVRLLQIALGDVWMESDDESTQRVAGYTPRAAAPPTAEVADWWLSVFPTGQPTVDQELARAVGLSGVSDERVAERLAARASPETAPDADLHYLFVLAELPGPWSEAAVELVAHGLAALQGKMDSRGWIPSRNWPEHVARLVPRLFARDPRLAAALARQEALASPAQAALSGALAEEQQRIVARRMLGAVAAASEAAPSGAVALLSKLPPEETRAAWRSQIDRFGPTPELLRQLSRSPEPQDAERFREGLGALDPGAVAAAAKGLTKLDGGDEDTIAAAMALRNVLDDDPADLSRSKARRALSRLLAARTGRTELDAQCAAGGDSPESFRAWLDWLASSPLGARLRPAAPADWESRRAAIAWDQGDVERGRAVFERRTCARCHDGSSRLGPELRGIGGRLSRDDLLTAIVDPHREIAPAYRLHAFETTDGRVVQGLLVYESPEATLVQIDAETSVRLRGAEIAAAGRARRSLMPEGLLDRLDDGEVADLLAYLGSLR